MNRFIVFPLITFLLLSLALPATTIDKESNHSIHKIKALMERIEKESEIYIDNFPALIKEVETEAVTSANVINSAILHSLTAEMYNSFYNNKKWAIDHRTPIAGYTPEDVNEWTANIFADKVKEHLTASLAFAETLQSRPISDFEILLNKGKDDNLRPTLYDFLIYRAIEMQPSTELYEQLIAYKHNTDNAKAILLAELDYAAYLNNTTSKTVSRNNYIATLDSLFDIHKENDYATEIQVARLNDLRNGLPLTGISRDSLETILYNLCKETIARYPEYERTNEMRNYLNSMESPSITISKQNVVYPNKEFFLTINYNNVEKVKISIYKSNENPEDVSLYSLMGNKDKRGALVEEVEVVLPISKTYQMKDTVVLLKLKNAGLYEYEITAEKEELSANALLPVSSLAAVARSLSSGEGEVLVTDYISGKPVKNAKVIYYKRKGTLYEAIGTVSTDKDGLAVIPSDKDLAAYRATYKTDRYSLPTSLRTSEYVYNNGDIGRTRYNLFTDRGLYRPGQTVFVKGIAYIYDKDNQQVLKNQTVSVTLRDTNNREIGRQDFTTNEFGSFNGEFVLPKQTLNGWFRLSAGNTSIGFSVEEYKRPTFSLELSHVKDEISFGDDIRIEGKAQTFSGISIYDGYANYRIIRRPYWHHSAYTNGFEEQVAFGTVATTTDGSFSIPFIPEKNDNTRRTIQAYEVIVSMTDSKGETQDARSHFVVGDFSFELFTNLSMIEKKETINAIVKAETLNGESVKVTGDYTITSLVDGKEVAIVTKGIFIADRSIDNSVFTALPSGGYRIKLMTKDNKGRTIEGKRDIILYSDGEKRPPVFADIWMPESHYVYCAPGEEAKLLFGTSHKDAYILYELYNKGQRIQRQRITMSNENRTFTIPFSESDGDGVVATFTFIKEGQLHTADYYIMKRIPNRSLTVETETFRDKLMPGNSESWRLRVLDADSQPVLAEILASMYDASLDKITPFQWSFSATQYQPNLFRPYFNRWAGFDVSRTFDRQRAEYYNMPVFNYNSLNLHLMLAPVFMTRSMRVAESNLPFSASMDSEAVFVEDEMEAMDAGELQESLVTSSVPQDMQEQMPVIRTNFNETAFFQPTLRTDKEGYFVIDFTLPESNTTWKLQTFVHTQDLYYGHLNLFAVSSKPIMVQPNLPRFVRKGDKVSVSTQIINKSDEAVSGNVRLELFNPINNQIITIHTEKAFGIAANKQSTASWAITAPDNHDLIGIRIVADAGSVSDGEQHILPVISNEILITESIPFYMTNEAEMTITPPMAKGNNQRSLTHTLELSSNLVWYAVQALSTQAAPANRDVLSWFAAYYTNTLAGSIVATNPRIKQVIDAWAVQDENPDLLSNLEKNDELKSILLEETPWVFEANNEAERKQRLGMLFNQNQTKVNRDAALKELISMQREDGAWGWFKGFYADRYITQRILNGMAQLVELNVVEFNQQEREMQMKALKYLDNLILREYNHLTENAKKNAVVSAIQLDYLFIRSHFRDIPEGDAHEAIMFYTNTAEKNWQKASLHGKAQTALLMNRNGKKDIAAKIMNWFNNTATTNAKDGMYWANNRRAAYSALSPVETHVLLMRAFDEVLSDTTNIDRMKQWLLNQKRTQDWGTGVAILNAVYALLLTGSDWINDDNNSVVKWDGRTIDTNTDGAIATGYIKKTRKAEEGTPITILKEGWSPTWGAVYHSYFSPINEATKNKGDLSVERTLFVEKNTDSGRQITPLAKGEALKVGDKVIVRLTIRSAQEMTYVHLKDLRAGCFEPAEQLSRTVFRDGLFYYQTAKDVSEQFFFDRLPKGTFVLEYPVHVSRTGTYSSGLSTIQCLYAPEYVSNTDGGIITVKE